MGHAYSRIGSEGNQPQIGPEPLRDGPLLCVWRQQFRNERLGLESILAVAVKRRQILFVTNDVPVPIVSTAVGMSARGDDIIVDASKGEQIDGSSESPVFGLLRIETFRSFVIRISGMT